MIAKRTLAPNRLLSLRPMLTFSIDDARKDFHTNAAPIMEQYGFVSTNNVITGWVDGTGTYDPDGSAGLQGPMSIAEVQYWDARGHETAAHSDTHTNDEADVAISVGKLIDWGISVKGFCSPYSGITLNNFVSRTQGFIDLGLEYCRSGELPGKTNIDALIPYGLPHPYYQYRLPSLVIYSTTTLATVQEYIQSAITNKTWCILMLHSILYPVESGYGADVWYWDATRFEDLCAWVSGQDIDVVTNYDGLLKIKGTL